MKKILIILIGNIRYDGRVKKEISSLVQFGYDVTLVVSEFDADDSIESYPCKIHILERTIGGNILKKFFRFLSHNIRMRKLIKEINPDYIHANDFSGYLYTYGIQDKFKIVYDSHELATEDGSKLMKKIIHFFQKRMLKNVYAVIMPQKDRINIFKFKYPCVKDKMFMLENFPNRADASLRNDYFDSYITPEMVGKQKIIYIGYISKERGLEKIITSLKDLQNYVFFIIGKSNDAYLPELTKLVKQNNQQDSIVILPPIPNSDVLYATNSVDVGFCFYTDPNLNSYFCASNKIYELMNCGVKVIANDIAGISRVFKDEINGKLIDELTVDELSSAMDAVLKMDNPPKTCYYWENQHEILKQIYR